MIPYILTAIAAFLAGLVTGRSGRSTHAAAIHAAAVSAPPEPACPAPIVPQTDQQTTAPAVTEFAAPPMQETAAEARLTEYRKQMSTLRHDIRGILSPALLVSDRLLSHEEAHVRRAGEVMIRTVERATQRLSETKLDASPAQAAPTSPQS